MPIIFTLIISGIVLICIAYLLKNKSQKRLVYTLTMEGILRGFQGKVWSPKYPLVEFYDNGNAFTISTDFSDESLTENDIGNQVKICVRKTESAAGVRYNICLDNEVSRKKIQTMQSRFFLTFIWMGIPLFLLSIIALIFYIKAVNGN